MRITEILLADEGGNPRFRHLFVNGSAEIRRGYSRGKADSRRLDLLFSEKDLHFSL